MTRLHEGNISEFRYRSNRNVNDQHIKYNLYRHLKDI